MSELSRPSHTIELSQFRQILIWPLALALHPDNLQKVRSDRRASIADMVHQLDLELGAQSEHWQQVADLADHAGKPGRISKPPDRKAEETDADYSKALAKWQRVETRTDLAQNYGEFVYFYDFLQRTLFGNAKTAPFKLWRRNGIDGLWFELRLNAHGKRDRKVVYQADVRRFNLYTFSTGAAIVAVEIDFGPHPRVISDAPQFGGADRRMTLEDALTINDHLRRVYTPFFSVKQDESDEVNRVPLEFKWLRNTGERMEPIAFDSFVSGETERQTGPLFEPEGLKATLRRVGLSKEDGLPAADARMAPVFDYWQRALRPVRFDEQSAGNNGQPIWRHVVDERLPLMSFIGLTGAAHRLGIGSSPAEDYKAAQRNDLALVSRGDWVRLCFAEEAGNDPMPYNPGFLADFEKTHCYDRFMASPETDSASRFLFASYHFAIVGSGSFFDELIVHHFRRHYFQMLLLANMEFASLLATSSRISMAVDKLTQASERRDGETAQQKAESGVRAMARFGHDLQEIQEDFLRFVHRFRFVGVSNQIQPTEIFDQLRGVMKLERLYADVKDELMAAVGFTHAVEQGQIAKSGMGLTAVATIAAAIGLALTLLGLGPIANPLALIDWVAAGQIAPGERAAELSFVNALFRWLWALGPISIVTLIFLALTKAFMWAIGRRLHEDEPSTLDPGERLISRFVDRLMAVFALAAFVFLVCLGLQIHA